MTNEDFREVSEGLRDISRQREKVRNSPVVISVSEMLAQINKGILGGKALNLLSGAGFEDLEFSLAWEGEHTKSRTVRVFNHLDKQVAPFNLIVKPVRLEGEEWLRFQVTANYSGEKEGSVSLGLTERLEPEELKQILDTQINVIRESSQK